MFEIGQGASEVSCLDCRHHEQGEETSDGYVIDVWFACGARNAVSNLRQFPFRKTSCRSFEPKDRTLKPYLKQPETV